MGEHLYISTGEVSGEQHAAGLLGALREQYPTLQFTGMGGEILRNAGVDTIVDMDACRVMGFWEILRYIPRLRQMLHTVMEHLEKNPPRALILVDYPGFHLRLARMVKERWPDLPILYYIAPKVWAWNERRIHKLRSYVDKLFVIFPFEVKYFNDRDMPAEYVGNPTLETIRQIPDTVRSETRAALEVPDSSRLVALFPGSRPAELQRLLPTLLQSARAAQEEWPDVRFVVGAAPGVSPNALEDAAGGALPCPVWDGDSHALMKASDYVIAKSGTTTLEAALLGIPMVVVYRVHPVSAWIGRRVIRCGWFSLPNLVAQKEVVRELFQEDVTPARILEEMQKAFATPKGYQQKQDELLALRATFGDAPAFEKAAQAIGTHLQLNSSVNS